MLENSYFTIDKAFKAFYQCSTPTKTTLRAIYMQSIKIKCNPF